MEKRGGWKTSRMTPPPKGGLDPPRTVSFPPPSGVVALFFLYKNPRLSRPEALLEGSRIFREGAFSGTFSSPHTCCTPPYHGPNFWGLENTLLKAKKCWWLRSPACSTGMAWTRTCMRRPPRKYDLNAEEEMLGQCASQR